jgi:hypothetical protein
MSGLMVYTSCEKHTIEPPDLENVSFSEDIIPLFNQNCISCHSGSTPSDGLSLEEDVAYQNLKDKSMLDISGDDANTSELYKKVNSGHGNLNLNQQEIIRVWILNGAENN